MDELFVITWRYLDGSASGCVRGYKTQDAAVDDLAMLREHGDTMKEFRIEEVPW